MVDCVNLSALKDACDRSNGKYNLLVAIRGQGFAPSASVTELMKPSPSLTPGQCVALDGESGLAGCLSDGEGFISSVTV